MKEPWSFDQAFGRNKGLISSQEQLCLSDSLIAIPGCGGIGSTVAETLARLGVGRFRLCDPDTFDYANFNRQLGATTHSVNKNKAEATKDRIRSINPNAEVEIFREHICEHNADLFVRDCDVVLDGIDFFALDARRSLFRAARAVGIPAMTAAPLGFSASLQVYLPNNGLSFDEFFDFKDNDSTADQLIKFLVGLAPKALHRSYTDLSQVDVKSQTGPSSILGTQIAASLIGGEVLRILLKRGESLPAPWYRQFDGYRQVWVKKRITGGNRHPIQRIKLYIAKQSFRKSGLWDDLSLLQKGVA